MKKVMFIMPDLAGGGAEKVLIDILNNFDYANYSVDLFLEYYSGIYIDNIPKEVSVVCLYKKRIFELKLKNKLLRIFGIWNWYYDFYNIPQFKKRIAKQYDTIISFMEGLPVKYHVSVVERAKNNVTWIHTDFQKLHWSLGAFRSKEEEFSSYKTMDHLIFVSNDALKSFQDIYPGVGQCRVIYNLIDREKIIESGSSYCISKKKFTICSVGRLTSLKGYDRLLQVAKRLKDEGYDLDFWILGIGELLSSLKAMQQELALEDSVHFLGFKNPPYPYMKAADLFALTSRTEGFPLVLCEALCLGTPVVSTAITGPKEILNECNYGLLVEENEQSIYEGIKRMVDDPVLLTYYSNMALLRSDMFDVRSTMSQIYSIIESI